MDILVQPLNRVIRVQPGANLLKALQDAFVEHNALQCGYCTPGMIMAADALLRRNHKPSEAQIRQELEGNMCRCTGYQNIVKAVQNAALKMA